MLKIILYLIQIVVFISLPIMADAGSDENLDSKNKVDIQVNNNTTVTNKKESKDLKVVVMHNK